jgi:hypothetical protein
MWDKINQALDECAFPGQCESGKVLSRMSATFVLLLCPCSACRLTSAQAPATPPQPLAARCGP